MLTIKAKIVVAYTLLFGLLLGGFALVIYHTMAHAAVAELDAHLESHADKVATEIEEEMGEGQFPAPRDILSLSTTGLANLHVLITDTLGHALLPGTAALPAARIADVTKGQGNAWLGSVRGGHDMEFRLLRDTVAIEGAGRMVLQIWTSMNEIEEQSARLQMIFLAVIPAALALGAGAAFVIIRAGFRPMSSMMEAVRRITAAHLDERLPVPPARDEVRSLAETLNAMIARLEAAFASQRQFIADASHEIRTPLTIIRTELEYSRRSTDPREIAESTEIALAEVDHLASLTQSLLLLVRLDGRQNPLVCEPVRLDEIMMESIRRIATLAGQKEITLEPHIDEALEASGDSEKLARAVLNLLDNAVKYSPRGSTVRVTLRRAGAYGEIVVSDQGPGIDAADLPDIFERFNRAASARTEVEGHGLGLSIVRKIAELHNGSAGISNAETGGAIASIRIPLA